MTDEQLPKHRVALVVFATVEAVDEHDAGYILERMLRDKIGYDEDRRYKLHHTMGLGMDDETTFHAEVVDMMSAGMAMRNGYLGAYPTSQAFRYLGIDGDPGPVTLS